MKERYEGKRGKEGERRKRERGRERGREREGREREGRERERERPLTSKVDSFSVDSLSPLLFCLSSSLSCTKIGIPLFLGPLPTAPDTSDRPPTFFSSWGAMDSEVICMVAADDGWDEGCRW